MGVREDRKSGRDTTAIYDATNVFNRSACIAVIDYRLNVLYNGQARLEGRFAIATLSIRNVDPELKEVLRVRAAQNGRSMEAELRVILRNALSMDRRDAPKGLASSVRKRFEVAGGVDLPEVADEPLEPSPLFR